MIFFLAWTTGSASALSLGLAEDTTFQIVSGQGFGPKEQGGFGAKIYLLIPLGSWMRLGTSFELSQTLPSDTSGGFVYRGYGSGAVGMFLEAAGPLGRWEPVGSFEAGGQLGVNADWAAYQYTTLYFFYPELMTEGFLGLRFAGLRGLQARLAIPIKVQFRRDLDYSFLAAVSLGVNYSFGGIP
ncbi:MAG TPA: hypothetical protein VMM82_12450 [Spirochaetia bacterium]|nr:hypothetical protein [Spirochaetia bacterium]